jgi:flagellar hook-basal body complex protein FliE
MSTTIQGLGQRAFELGKGAAGASSSESSAGSDFMNTLRGAMDQIGQLQGEADSKVAQLLNGNGQDVHSAMIAVEKANLAFEMMVQVRNKIVQAYQQVSGIPF